MQSTAQLENEASSAIAVEIDLRSKTNAGTSSTNNKQVKSKRSPKDILRISLIILAGGLILAGGTAWWLHASSIQTTDDAFIAGHIHQLSSRIAGTVTDVTVKDNQHVKAEQLLVKIDPRDYQISADIAKAAAVKAEKQALEAQSNIIYNSKTADARQLEASYGIVSAHAQINKAQFSLDGARAGVHIAQAQVQQREAEFSRAVADFNRYESLVKDRAVTVQSFETARQNKQVAEANLKAAQENYNQALSRVSEFQQALADAQASLVRVQSTIKHADAATAQTEASIHKVSVEEAAAKQAEGQYKNALLQLSYTNVIAPTSGTIGHKSVETGQQIERGQALMSVVSDEKWVVANFKETQLEKMRVGQKVDITIDAFPAKHFQGKVDSIAPASGAQFALLPPDNASGNFTKVVQRIPVKIVFDTDSIKDYKALLTPGMSVLPEVHIQ